MHSFTMEASELTVVALQYCSKILDPDMSPLGFDAKKLYRFVAIRFKKTSAKVQEQALNWLQVRSTPVYSDVTQIFL